MDEARFNNINQFHSDFLVIGSGLAGLYAALYASKFGEVSLLTKSTLEESNSYWAQGGIAAAVDPEDSPVFHLEDTIKAGRGLCNREAVEVLVREGRERVMDLISLGMKFDLGEKGLELGLEGGHSKRRVLHAGGSSTGKEMVQFLISSVKSNPNVHIFENTMVSELISDGEKCFGALAYLEGSQDPWAFVSESTILATGGASGIYLRTTNPPSATGDGIVLAYRTGAEVTDMEFIQFHPTALYTEDGGSFLISEAVRGEGAYLLNHSGHRFMPDYHRLAELAPRDVVSRAIFNEMKVSGKSYVFLDLRHLNPDFIYRRFLNIYNASLSYGIDITKNLVPVAPAAHYLIGGVKTGLMADTNVNGLFACGEVACTGVHGANRLASNSLLECIVFAKRAIDGARDISGGSGKVKNYDSTRLPLFSVSQKDVFFEMRKRISQLMTDYVGIVRRGGELEKALSGIAEVADSINRLAGYYKLKLQNIVDVCFLIAKSAFIRTESRGAHIREDFPNEDPLWEAHIVLKKDSEPLVVK